MTDLSWIGIHEDPLVSISVNLLFLKTRSGNLYEPLSTTKSISGPGSQSSIQHGETNALEIFFSSLCSAEFIGEPDRNTCSIVCACAGWLAMVQDRSPCAFIGQRRCVRGYRHPQPDGNRKWVRRHLSDRP